MDTTEKHFSKESRYIGVFDSGIGGLTVVKSILEAMPQENILYFGDTAHVPYGSRSKEQITEYVMNDVRFLNSFDIKAVVIACNTADSIARKAVEKKYPDLPVFGVVEPASEKAAHGTKNGKIGVIATNATVASGAYERAIARHNAEAKVITLACPLLVPLVEEGRTKKGDAVIESVLNEYLTPLKDTGIDTLVLGCTHYPLLHELIEQIMPDVSIISSSVAAAEALQKDLTALSLLNRTADRPAKRNYFVSDNAAFFEKKAAVFMGAEFKQKVTEVEI